LQEIACSKKVRGQFHNFFVYSIGHFVFVIFPASGHVNVSGLKNLHSELDEARKALCEVISYPGNSLDIPVTVDNITAICRIDCSPVNLPLLKQRLEGQGQKGISVSLRPYSFPSAVLRRANFPTLQIFSTGNVVIVGAKNQEAICRAHKSLCAYMKQL